MSVYVKPTSFDLEIECEECQSNDSKPCEEDRCDEALKEFKEEGWIFLNDKRHILCFCDKECSIAYMQGLEHTPNLPEVEPKKVYFEELEGVEVTI